MKRCIVMLAAVFPAVFAACDSPTFPDSTLAVELAVTPLRTAPGDSVLVAVTVTNRRGSTLKFRTPSGCLTDFEIRDSADEVVGRPSGACTAAITEQTFAPGESRTSSYYWRPYRPGTADPLPAGDYTVVGFVMSMERPPKFTRSLQVTVVAQ